jgi:hypothetical protein
MKFSEYVSKYSVNVADFCRKTNLAYGTVWCVYREKKINLSILTAKRILDHCGGHVTFEDLCEGIRSKGKKKKKSEETESEKTKTPEIE